MFSFLRSVWVVFVLTILMVIPAQPQSSGTPEVSNLMSEFLNIWNSDDASAFNDYFDDNITFVGDGFLIKGKTDLIEKWVKFQMPTSKELKVSDVLNDGLAGDIAYQTGRWDLLFQPKEGAAFNTFGSHTFVWEKKGDMWKLISIMISNDPPKSNNK